MHDLICVHAILNGILNAQHRIMHNDSENFNPVIEKYTDTCDTNANENIRKFCRLVLTFHVCHFEI